MGGSAGRRPTSTLLAFGRAVRTRRERRGLSTAELAALARLRAATVEAIERGEHAVRFSHMVALAAALEVRPSELMRDAEREELGCT